MHWLKQNIRQHKLTDWIEKNPGVFCVFLLLIWTFTGLTGHDPWKPDEAHTFGVTYSAIKDGYWVVPTLAGEVYLKSPALVYISSAITAIFFESFIPLHDGARLSTGIWMLVVFAVTALTAKELWGGTSTWLAPTILAGCVGLLVRGHQLTNSIILLASISMAIYGLAVAPRRFITGGIALGLGIGLSSLATGLIDLIMIIMIVLGMVIVSPIYRTRRFAISSLIALSSAIAIGLVWPTLLYQKSEHIFLTWLHNENLFRLQEIFTISDNDDFLYYLKILLWFSWPAWPFALWSLWIARVHIWYRREVQLPIIAFLCIFIFLSITGEGREIYALPLLLPMSLLAATGFQRLPRSAANAFFWFSIMIASVFIILCWFFFGAIRYQFSIGLIGNISELDILVMGKPQLWRVYGGVLITFCWIFFLFNIKKSLERPAIIWTLGVTVGWFLVVVLLFPWINHVKTYKDMVIELKQTVPSDITCIARYKIGEPQRAMLHYFGGIITSKLEEDKPERPCELLLIQGNLIETHLSPKNWEEIWSGNRPNDLREQYRLYKQLD